MACSCEEEAVICGELYFHVKTCRLYQTKSEKVFILEFEGEYNIEHDDTLSWKTYKSDASDSDASDSDISYSVFNHTWIPRDMGDKPVRLTEYLCVYNYNDNDHRPTPGVR